MNYHLIGFVEPSWKHKYGLAGMWLVTFALYLYSSPRVAVIALCVSGFSFALKSPRRCTPFEAAMPIRARDLFCARMLSDAARIWLMNLAVVAGILASSKGPGIAILAVEMGAIVTLGQIAFHAVDIERSTTPRWWRFTVVAALLIAVGTVSERGAFFPPALTICLLAVCALGSAALFRRTWALLPGSFQIAPVEPLMEKVRERKLQLPSFAKLPALRTLFPASSIGYFCSLVLFGLIGTQFLGTFLGTFLGSLSICSGISRVRRNGGWLLSLPISRQTLFLTILAPLGSFTLGGVAAFIFSQQTARATVVDSMVVLATSLLVVAVLGIPSFARRLPGVRFILMWAAFLTLDYLVWRGYLPAADAHGMGMAPVEVWLGRMLPAGLPLLIVIAAAVVGAMYWLAYAGFRRMEVTRWRGRHLTAVSVSPPS